MEQDEIDITEGRARIYIWLAHLFLQKPNREDLARALDQTLLDGLKEAIGNDDGPIGHLRAYSENLDEFLGSEIGQTYQELFMVPLPTKYVPPYESCFREGPLSQSGEYGETWGKTTTQVRECYDKHGFDPHTGNIPPDHIGIEFLFMSKMCSREIEVKRRGDEGLTRSAQGGELEFLEEHLVAWLPKFAQRLARIRNAGIYAHLAALAEIFVERDIEYLKDCLGMQPTS